VQAKSGDQSGGLCWRVCLGAGQGWLVLTSARAAPRETCCDVRASVYWRSGDVFSATCQSVIVYLFIRLSVSVRQCDCTYTCTIHFIIEGLGSINHHQLARIVPFLNAMHGVPDRDLSGLQLSPPDTSLSEREGKRVGEMTMFNVNSSEHRKKLK
jgi:hypothetical protein